MRRFTKVPIAGVLIAAIFAGLVYLFAWSSIFSVSSISVFGAPTPETESSILKISHIETGEKLARVEPRAIAHRITNFTWIKRVEISRNWINGKVEIKVTPRTPTAYFNGATIDSTGTVFTLPGFAGGDLPRVSASNPQNGLSAIALFQSLPREFKSQVTSLNAHDGSHFSMYVNLNNRDLRIQWGKNEKTELKIQVIQALVGLEENKGIRRIDVSAPHAPIVK